MGISIFTKSEIVRVGFPVSYSSFAYLKQKIANVVDKEFGEKYAGLAACHTREECQEWELELLKLGVTWPTEKFGIVLLFLLPENETQTVRPYLSKTLYKLLKDYKENWLLGYGGRDKEIYFSDFKQMLHDCAKHKVNWYWS